MSGDAGGAEGVCWCDTGGDMGGAVGTDDTGGAVWVCRGDTYGTDDMGGAEENCWDGGW